MGGVRLDGRCSDWLRTTRALTFNAVLIRDMGNVYV